MTEELAGPIGHTRNLISRALNIGAVSVSYQAIGRFKTTALALPHLHFAGDKKFSRHQLPPDHAEVIGRCHEFIIKNGKPIVLSDLLPLFAKQEPELTETIMTEANELGVYDQFMVPVFGPYDTNGVVSFGFATKLDSQKAGMLAVLEALAMDYHHKLIRHFGERKSDIELSTRENEVLHWIARGKSTSEIATILGISPSSVDTYTRRIFEKMGVYDRVSAAVKGLKERLVSLD